MSHKPTIYAPCKCITSFWPDCCSLHKEKISSSWWQRTQIISAVADQCTTGVASIIEMSGSFVLIWVVLVHHLGADTFAGTSWLALYQRTWLPLPASHACTRIDMCRRGSSVLWEVFHDFDPHNLWAVWWCELPWIRNSYCSYMNARWTCVLKQKEWSSCKSFRVRQARSTSSANASNPKKVPGDFRSTDCTMQVFMKCSAPGVAL